MKVYLLIHDDREYDMGSTYVRGVFATEAAALAEDPAGDGAYDAHAVGPWGCCSVDEWDVESAKVLA